MAYIARPEFVLDYLVELLKNNQDALGIKYIGYGTENLIPQYPAVDVTSADTVREIVSTNYFKVKFEINMWIYHANLMASKHLRVKEDLELVTNVVQLLHQDLTHGNRFIFSYVHDEDPGIITKASSAIVTTRIAWAGESRIAFNAS